MFEGEVIDPQSLHKYAYVHEDPISAADPRGLSREGNEQPFNFKLGNAAHKAIQDDYENWAIGKGKDILTEPYNTSFQNLIRPDLLNLTDHLVGEIKPFSVRSITAGYVKLLASQALLNGGSTFYNGNSIPAPSAGPLLGNADWSFEKWAPGNKGIKVYLLPTLDENLIVTLGNWKGLIVYKNFRRRKAETQDAFAFRAEQEARRVLSIADVNADGRLTGNEIELADSQWEFLNPVVDTVEAIGYAYLGIAVARSVIAAVSLTSTVNRLSVSF